MLKAPTKARKYPQEFQYGSQLFPQHNLSEESSYLVLKQLRHKASIFTPMKMTLVQMHTSTLLESNLHVDRETVNSFYKFIQ